MAEQKLPTPATSGEQFTHAAVMELRKLNATLDKLLKAMAPAEPEGDEVELREPEKKATTRDAKQAAAKVADEAVGPVTVETKRPGERTQVDIVDPAKSVGSERKA